MTGFDGGVGAPNTKLVESKERAGTVQTVGLSAMRTLIDRPTLLLWISNRSPDAWMPESLLKKPQMGSFPQLVGRKLYESVAALFDARFEHLTGPSSEQPLSRITGEPCPFLGFRGKDFQTEITYYPSSADNALVAESLAPLARDMLRTSGA